MTRRILAAALVLAVALAALVAFWPQLFSLERVFGVAQLVSLRGLATLLAAVLAIVLLGVAIASRGARRLAATLAVVVIAFAAGSAAVLATRGAEQPAAERQPGDIRVLTWNTLGDAPGAEAIARLALDEGADIVVLPETSSTTARAVAELMRAEGRGMDARSLWYDEIAIARTTSLLISDELGAYERDESVGETRTLPSFVMRPVSGEGPVIVAAHPVAPVPGEMTAWRQGLSWLAERCTEPGVIVAGDLNSTLDHYQGLAEGGGDLGGCRDAARTTGGAAVGTWPTDAAPLLGAPIDHVMASDGWRAVAYRVVTELDDSGSDHRPVVATLRPAG